MLILVVFAVGLASQTPPAHPLVVARAEVEALVAGLFDSDDPASVALPGVEVCDLAIARDTDFKKATTCIKRHMSSCRPAVAARAAIDWSSHEWEYLSILWVRPTSKGCDLIHILDQRTRTVRVPSTGRLAVRKCDLSFDYGLDPVSDIGSIVNCSQAVVLTKQ